MAVERKFEFPNCMHAFSAALHMQNIDPGTVVISMPREQWWALWRRLESQFRGVMTYDPRQKFPPDQFTYMGIRFRPLDL